MSGDNDDHDHSQEVDTPTVFTTQYYETVLFDVRSSSFFFLTIPSRSLPKRSAEDDSSQDDRSAGWYNYLLDDLNLESLTLVNAVDLENAVATLVSNSDRLGNALADHSLSRAKADLLSQLFSGELLPSISEEDRRFAHHLVSSRVIPFENSPLSPSSLQEIVRGATSTGAGAYIGFVLAGPTPLLLLTVPAGVVICGAAWGVAKGLEDGLRKRVAKLISKARPRKNR